MRILLAIISVFAVCGPTFADVISPNGKVIDCYCTDKSGSRVELGEFICLQVDGRMFTAQCQMSLNVPMWREISPGCLSSNLDLHETEQQSVNPTIHNG